MPSIFIRVKIEEAECTLQDKLEMAMKNENFVKMDGNEAVEEKIFAYYGNLELAEVGDAVKRAGASVGKSFCFNVSINTFAEKQYHRPVFLSVNENK